MWLNFINKDAAWLGNTLILNISPFKQIKDNFQKITKILCELGKITLPLQIVVVCLNGRLNGQDFWGGEIVCWHGLLTEACGGRFCGESSVISTERSEWRNPWQINGWAWADYAKLLPQKGAGGLCKLLTIKELRDSERDEWWREALGCPWKQVVLWTSEA